MYHDVVSAGREERERRCQPPLRFETGEMTKTWGNEGEEERYAKRGVISTKKKEIVIMMMMGIT